MRGAVLRGPVRAAAASGGGGSVAILFGSEWRHSTGGAPAAFRDNTRWPSVGPGTTDTNAAEIIAGDSSLTGRGNYFRIKNAGTDWRIVSYDDLVPGPETDHWGRCYFRSNRTDNIHNHWIALGGAGPDIQWAIGSGGLGPGERLQIQSVFNTSGGSPGYPNQLFSYNTTVGQNVWLCVEWHINYLSSSRYRNEIWVNTVDSAGNFVSEIANSTSFLNDISQTLTARQDANSTYYGWNSVAGMRKYVVGNEGPFAGLTNAGYFDLASFGLSTEGRLRDQSLGLS